MTNQQYDYSRQIQIYSSLWKSGSNLAQSKPTSYMCKTGLFKNCKRMGESNLFKKRLHKKHSLCLLVTIYTYKCSPTALPNLTLSSNLELKSLCILKPTHSWSAFLNQQKLPFTSQTVSLWSKPSAMGRKIFFISFITNT